MEDVKGFMPVIIGVAILFVILWAFGAILGFLADNPIILVLLLGAVGAGIYFWIKSRRARTMV
jgi:hypothetical protein